MGAPEFLNAIDHVSHRNEQLVVENARLKKEAKILDANAGLSSVRLIRKAHLATKSKFEKAKGALINIRNSDHAKRCIGNFEPAERFRGRCDCHVSIARECLKELGE